MSDYVNVYLRVRPQLRQIRESVNENSENHFLNSDASTERMIVVDSLPYQFDRVFYKDSTQDDIFHHMVEQKVQKVLQGFNVLIFAYGQSGAGKTYTIGLKESSTNASDAQNSQGIITRAIDYIFQEINNGNSGTAGQTTVQVSFVEIYKEKVFDLLSSSRDVPIYQKGKHYYGSIKSEIHNSLEAHNIIKKGNRNRHVRGTTLNANSSRSHALFTIEVKNDKMCAVMNICDLAGSEGLRSTNHFGTPQAEGIEINKGLLALKRAIQELSNRKKVTSHRESVLTMILQSSLNLKSYFAIIGCITPNRDDKTETQSTIRFLQDVKKLNANAAPEINAFRQKQRSAQTPLRSYMLPASRNSSLLNSNSILSKTPMNFNTSNHLSQASTMIKKRSTAFGSIMKRFQTPSTIKKRQTSVTVSSTHRGVSDTSGLNDVNSVENTFNVSNCSTSTEVGQIGNLNGIVANDPNITMSMTKIPSFSPYERKMKMLEEQVKRYEQVLFSATNFEQFQQSMMMSTTNNFYDLNSTFNVLQDENQTSFRPTISHCSTNRVPRTSTVQPFRMDFSIMETTNFSNTKENRQTSKQNQIMNRGVFTHVNISQELPGDETIVRIRTPLAPIQTRQSVRINKRVKQSDIEKAAEIEKQKMMDINEVMSLPAPKFQKQKNILTIFNEGTSKDLEKIPLVGKKTATQIIIQRNKKPFKKIEDLRRISYFTSDKSWKKFLACVSLE